MERAGVEPPPPTCATPSPPGLLLPSKCPFGEGGKEQEKKKLKGDGEWWAEKGHGGATNGRYRVNWTDTPFSSDTHRQCTDTTEAHTSSVFSFSSNLDPCRWDYQNRKIHPSAQGPHPAPPTRGQRPQARRSLFSGSRRPWACSPWTLRWEDEETAPTSPALDSLFSLSPAWISYWCPVRPGSAPSISRCGLPPLQIVG